MYFKNIVKISDIVVNYYYTKTSEIISPMKAVFKYFKFKLWRRFISKYKDLKQ